MSTDEAQRKSDGERSDDRACGGDRRRRSDGPDAGGRAGAGGGRCRRSSSGAPSQELDGSRAGGLHARTIEVLDQRGVAERFLAEGQAHAGPGVRRDPLDISDFPTRHNYGLALWQSHFERILAAWVGELGVPILRGREVVGLRAGRRPASTSSCPTARRCGRSTWSGATAGAAWSARRPASSSPGWDPSTSWLIAEVEMDEEPEFGIRREGGGIGPVGPGEGGEPYGVVLRRAGRRARRRAHAGGSPRGAHRRRTGRTSGAHSPTWISRFTDMTRQAASYRKGRVLLAGDAAHVHPPQGGQGLNIGVQDAVNLGWKLAQVVNGTSPDGLLDTYHAERHPVGARVLHNTMAQVALSGTDDRHRGPARHAWPSCSSMDEPRKRIAAMMSGLDIHYDLGEGHPLLGRRMPDLDLATADGPHAGLRAAARRPAGAAQPRRARRLRHRSVGRPGRSWSTPTYDGAWELPVLGAVAAPAAVLIRPDGYVAWVGRGHRPGLADALTTWFGAPAAACRRAFDHIHKPRGAGMFSAVAALTRSSWVPGSTR